MAKFEEVSKHTLADRVFVQLHAAIVSGEFKDGEELNQVALAEQFSVSRVPVREALWRLEADNLVVATPQQRFRVAQMDADAILELCDIRELLEIYALRRRMQTLDQSSIDELRSAADLVAQAATGEEWLAADRNFHRLVNGGNTPVAGLIETVRSQIHRYLRIVVSTDERRRQAREEHTALLDAIVDGDARRAEQLLRRHIRATRKVLAEHL